MNRSIFSNSLFSSKNSELHSNQGDSLDNYSQTSTSFNGKLFAQEYKDQRTTFNHIQKCSENDIVVKKRRTSKTEAIDYKNNFGYSSDSDAYENFNSDEELGLEEKTANQIIALLKKEQYRLSLSTAKQNILNERLKHQVDKVSKATKMILRYAKALDERTSQNINSNASLLFDAPKIQRFETTQPQRIFF